MGDRVGPEIVFALVHQPFDLVEERHEPRRRGEDEEHRALHPDPRTGQSPVHPLQAPRVGDVVGEEIPAPLIHDYSS